MSKFQKAFFELARTNVANTRVPRDHGGYLESLVEIFEENLLRDYPDAQLNPYISGNRLVLVADQAQDLKDDTFFVEYELRGRGRAVFRRKGRVQPL